MNYDIIHIYITEEKRNEYNILWLMFQPKERTLMQFFYPFLLIPRSIKKIPYFIRFVTQSIIPVTGHYAQK